MSCSKRHLQFCSGKCGALILKRKKCVIIACIKSSEYLWVQYFHENSLKCLHPNCQIPVYCQQGPAFDITDQTWLAFNLWGSLKWSDY